MENMRNISYVIDIGKSFHMLHYINTHNKFGFNTNTGLKIKHLTLWEKYFLTIEKFDVNWWLTNI